MANKNIVQFIETYGPVAQQVSKEINVDPNVLLSQWGLESRWGQSEMAKTHHNVGGIKDFSGKGHEAKDNKTGSMDKYVKFEDPEVFGMYYADQIKRNFPLAINTGPDIGAFTRGLASGKNGSYFGVKPMEYEQTLSSFYSAIPENKLLPFEPTAQPAEKPAEGDGDPVLINAPPPPPPTEDKSGASAGERFLGGAMGAGVGTAASGVKGVSNARTSMAASRAGAEETARIAAQQRAAASAAAAIPPGAAPAAPGAPRPPLGSSIMFQGQPPAAGSLQVPMGPADAGRMAQGQTGAQVYNYGKAAGLTDIEAGRALDTTKQAGGVHDLSTARREGMNKVQSLFPGEKYVENPRYGGLLTLDQGAGSGPRQSYVYKPTIAPTPELPQGQPGGLSQLPPRQPVSTAPVAPKAASGLDAVTNMFKGMMQPVTTAAKTIGKYALPPLAGLSAGLDLSEIAHEYDKPADQRDYTKMGLKAASAIGGGLSMIPVTAPLGIPLTLGATAVQAARDNPNFLDQLKSRIGDMPYSDPMTGYMTP
jgi:hypothetical protein